MMRYIPNDKYTIAWFKLADCVAKGEKEKAFGVYRLLMHSLEDQAYAHQLEGDLLDAFQDERAVEKYAYAAQLYSKNNRYKEAAALYHALIFMVPHDTQYIIRLIDIYKNHKKPDAFTLTLTQLIDLLLEKRIYASAIPILLELETLDAEIATHYYTKTIIAVVQEHPELEEVIGSTLYKALDFMSQPMHKKQLQQLLSSLEQVNAFWYEKARKYIVK